MKLSALQMTAVLSHARKNIVQEDLQRLIILTRASILFHHQLSCGGKMQIADRDLRRLCGDKRVFFSFPEYQS